MEEESKGSESAGAVVSAGLAAELRPVLVVKDELGKVDAVKSLSACEGYVTECAGKLIASWDGNSKKRVARVDSLLLAELRFALEEQGRAAVRLVQANR